MKYCLSSRQNKNYLQLADEIFVQDRDYRQVIDLIVDYPDKIIILEIRDWEDENKLKAVKQYKDMTDKLCCCVYDLRQIDWLKENNIKFYYGYPINNYYDVKGLQDLGVEYVKITAPLTFDVDTLKTYKCKFRIVPNVAYDAYIPRLNGICGQWIRPEDTQCYEDAIEVFEFEDAGLDKERTLYDIYAVKKVWKGNLNLLITNLNYDVDNRAIPEEIGELRSKCRQRCMANSSCHYCETAFKFEKTLKLYRERARQEKQN